MTAPNTGADHLPNPHYPREDRDEGSDSPPLTDHELARARPGAGNMPAEMAAAFTSRAGRPKADVKRVPISLRVDPEVLETFKATGPGWQTRMHDALAEAARKLKAA